MSRARVGGVGLLLAAALTTAGCKERHAAAPGVSRPGVDTLRLPAESPAIPNATRQPGALATVRAAPVELWTGPGARPFEVATRTSEEEAGHARRFGSITLQTALRARPLGQYPCTSCHLGRKVVMAEKRTADAHQNVQPVHPKQTGALCSTCHAADNVELLALENGERVTLDESYRLCAECHFAQVDAWAAARMASGSTAGRDAASSWFAPTATIRTGRLWSRAFLSARRKSSEPGVTTSEP